MNPCEALPVETLAWVSVRAAVRPFLSDREIVFLLSSLHGHPYPASSCREIVLEGYARESTKSPQSAVVAVENWLSAEFDDDQCFALAAFVGMVRRYPDVCRLTTVK